MKAKKKIMAMTKFQLVNA